jgi:TIR domain-containing protein
LNSLGAPMNTQIEFSQDVFISYSKDDLEWVDSELLMHMDQAGITYIEERGFRLGSLTLNEIENAITGSRRTLLVVSSKYLEDTWQEFANNMAFAYVLQTGQWRIIPVLREDCKLPMRLITLVPLNLFQDDTEESWSRLIGTLSADQPIAEVKSQKRPHEEGLPKSANDHPARDGLIALLELMNEPEIRGPVSEFRADFKALCDQIKMLGGYKKVHDVFQQLEDQYSLIYHHGKSASIGQLDWEAIEIIDSRFQDVAADLVASACKASFATEQDLWVQKLSRARDEMRVAIETKDNERLKSGIRRICGVLNTVPSRVNASMVASAKALRFTSLETALMTVLDTITHLYSGSVAAGQLDKIRKSVDELNGLDTNLRAILYLHDSMQEIDDELRRVEPLLDEDVQQVIDAWQDLRPKMQRLCGGNLSEWASSLFSIGAELESSLATEDRGKIKRMFRAFRSQATRSFNQVDQSMLSLCSELEQEVGRPLAPLLAMLS